jgi:hypothetical protein
MSVQEMLPLRTFNLETILSTAKLSVRPTTYRCLSLCLLILYTINSVYVSDPNTFTSDINAQGYYGLLGLGPNSGSLVGKKISGDSRGDTMLTHIFETDGLSDNYISFLLDRKGVPNPPFKGQITISEIVPGFENITSMPKIDVDKVNRLLKAGTLNVSIISYVTR